MYLKPSPWCKIHLTSDHSSMRIVQVIILWIPSLRVLILSLPPAACEKGLNLAVTPAALCHHAAIWLTSAFIICWRPQCLLRLYLLSLWLFFVSSPQILWRSDGGAGGSLFYVEEEAARWILPHWNVTTARLVKAQTHTVIFDACFVVSEAKLNHRRALSAHMRVSTIWFS